MGYMPGADIRFPEIAKHPTQDFAGPAVSAAI